MADREQRDDVSPARATDRARPLPLFGMEAVECEPPTNRNQARGAHGGMSCPACGRCAMPRFFIVTFFGSAIKAADLACAPRGKKCDPPHAAVPSAALPTAIRGLHVYLQPLY